jgi:hypothetical protein
MPCFDAGESQKLADQAYDNATRTVGRESRVRFPRFGRLPRGVMRMHLPGSPGRLPPGHWGEQSRHAVSAARNV